MGKGGAAKIEVTEYYMSQHFGVCVSVDALLKITIKEKTAWSGEWTDLTTYPIQLDNLFGGATKEGGATGTIYYLPGADDQLLPDVLATRLGRSSGADCPAYRGLCTVFFTGRPDANKGARGFYWSANSPYLPGVWFTVRRAPKGLDAAYAMIPRVADAGPTLIAEVDDDWLYKTEAPGNSADYSAEAYDDSAWSEGQGGFGNFGSGYNTPPAGTIILGGASPVPTGSSVWLRKHLGPLTGEDIQLQVWRDDGCQVWFNGTQISISDVTYFEGAGTIPTGLINTGGDNVIAIKVTDSVPYGNSTYIYAGARLYRTAGAGEDANPAHIIYECLTNTDWGMGSPTSLIDQDSFTAAAIALYGEGLGLSLLWTRQAAIQDFVQEILDHIVGVLFVDPSTGLMTLNLIRGDYDTGSLPELNPSNADLSNFGRKLWGEIVNEIVVTWTNPDTEQDETVTAHDLASIVTQGLISDGRNYYGVRSKGLAQQLAQRDLRAAGAPLATCEAEVDRSQWQLRPASVVRVTWPEHGLLDLVMRVTEIDYGKPGDMGLKLSLVEDVFGLDAADYVDPPGTIWEDPASPPEPLEFERAFTLPLFMAADTTVAAFVNSPEYPEVIAGVLGSGTNADNHAIELWGEVTLPDSTTEWQQLGNLNVVGRGLLENPLAAEATSTGVTFTDFTGQTNPTQAGFALIGDGDEDEVEIALITAAGTDYDLSRGVLDTVPRAWADGTPVWFVDGETLFEDPNVRAAGEVVSYKLLPQTSQGLLALADASLVTTTLTERPWLPNRPANVTIDGVLFNDIDSPVDMTGESVVPVSWANRNRLLEDSQVLAWTDGNVTPEAGQTTTIRVFETDGSTVITTHDGLTGTSFNIPLASFGTANFAIVEVSAERTDADGTFASLQAHRLFVHVDTLTFDEDDVTFDATEYTWDEG